MTENYVFKTLSEIDVKDHIDKKGNFSYLSWPWAVSEVMKRYPDMTYNVRKYEGGRLFTGDSKTGYMVSTDVTIDGINREMWLPIMDMRNKAVLNPTSTDVNKAIMRSLVKNLAMFGLGLYIYAGEDLPDIEPEKISANQVDVLNKKLKIIKENSGKDVTDFVNERLNIKALEELISPNYQQANKIIDELVQKSYEVKNRLSENNNEAVR